MATQKIDTHDLIIPFGKHKGERVTRLPVSYLQWSVATNVSYSCETKEGRTVPFHMIAYAEIQRRGLRNQSVEISAHAVDKFSVRHLGKWEANRLDKEEGIRAFIERIFMDALEQAKTMPHIVIKEDATTKTIRYLKIDFVVQTDLIVPVLLTVT